jgi:hypothetical protein
MGVISFDDNFSSVRVISFFGTRSSFVFAQDDRTIQISSKTVLDTFFVPLVPKTRGTKNTRTDAFNNYTQRVIMKLLWHGLILILWVHQTNSP